MYTVWLLIINNVMQYSSCECWQPVKQQHENWKWGNNTNILIDLLYVNWFLKISKKDSLLDLFLTSSSDSCCISQFCPLGNFDYVVVSVDPSSHLLTEPINSY